jgi:hypothetical protein
MDMWYDYHDAKYNTKMDRTWIKNL